MTENEKTVQITESLAILLDAIANRVERKSLKKALRSAASQIRKYGPGKTIGQ